MDENVLKFPSKGDFIHESMSMPIVKELEGKDNIPVKIVYDGLTNILPTLNTLIVIGSDSEGRFFFASSELEKSSILYDLKTAEYSLMMQGLE